MAVRAVFLVGYMACGKTCIGQLLARRLDWDFIDLDAQIEAQENRTIPEIFAEREEHGFRLAEANALRNLIQALEGGNLTRNTVVALGGGTFEHSTNRELLRRWPTIFLEAPLDELWRRAQEQANNRPLRKDRTEFTRLYEQRLPFYRQASVTIVTSGNNQASLCAEIERSLLSWDEIGRRTTPSDGREGSVSSPSIDDSSGRGGLP